MNYDIINEIKSRCKNVTEEQISRIRNFLRGIKINPATVKYDETTNCLQAVGNEDIYFEFYLLDDIVNIDVNKKNVSAEFYSNKNRLGRIDAQDEWGSVIVLNEKGAFLSGYNGTHRPYEEFYDLSTVEYIKVKANEMGKSIEILSAEQFREFAKSLFIKPDWSANMIVPSQDVSWYAHLIEKREYIKNVLLNPELLTNNIEKSMEKEELRKKASM